MTAQTRPASKHTPAKKSLARPNTPALRKPCNTIAAAQAKAHLLRLLDQVERDRKPILISKRGRPVAQLVPAPAQDNQSWFDRVYGSMAGSMTITGDIVSPDWESWGPEWR